MNSTGLFNRIGITLYSAITSILSGINHLIDRDEANSRTNEQSVAPAIVADALMDDIETIRPGLMRWESIQQALLSFIFWVILGLAAGFLLGMIKGG